LNEIENGPDREPNIESVLPVMKNPLLRNEETWKKRLEGVDMTPDGLYDAIGVIQNICEVHST